MSPGRALLRTMVAAIAAAMMQSAVAVAAELPFAEWLDGVRQEARGQGISEATLTAALAGVQPIDRVLELDRKQPEFTLTFQQYLDRVVTADRVERGRQRLIQHRALLDEVGRHYGVSPRFIVALWGVETDFGRLTGGFPVVDALATLAYDGRRSAYFRKELMQALTIIEGGHIAPEEMRGSWAGAMGQCQFMPSSYVRFARDQDGDGRADIWTTPADVFASAANYLSSSGWKAGETWGRAVTLPPGLDAALINGETLKPLAEWQALGVRRADGGALPRHSEVRAAVIAAEPGGPAFLVYDNFRTILKWNRSVFFGLAVGHLADRIATP